MVDVPLPHGLHVILGDSAAGIFRRVFHPSRDQLDIDRDVLSCGPIPRCESLDAWEAMRLDYWHALVPLGLEHPSHPAMDLADRAHRLRTVDRINIWVGTGLSEQLSMAFTIHLAGQGMPTPGKLWAVQFEYLPGSHDDVYGLGILNEQRMSEHPKPTQLSPTTLQDYRDAWAAATSPDPMLIERFCESHPNANRWLQRAMKLLLHRFPDRTTGLNYWDFALLSESKGEQRSALRVIGGVFARRWGEGDPVGDFFLFGRLLGLGHRAKPLIELSGDGMNMRYTEVELTPFGLDVLEGRASNYPANAIEDWAAGVRLSSREGALWFNDAGRLVRA